MFSLFLHRILTRLNLWFHRYWWLTYNLVFSVLLVIGVKLLNKILSTNIPILPRTFSELAMAIGGIAVLAIAIRQHKDARLQIEINQNPEVVRHTASGTFIWGKSTFFLNGDIDLKNIFRVRIFEGTFITNIKGYILYEGWYYPLFFADPNVIEQAKKEEEERKAKGVAANGITIQVPSTQTYARGEHQLIPIPNQAAKKKCSYPGPYYCITFSLPSGRKYFLEEDEQYCMRLLALEDNLPSWRKDFLSWL